MGPVLKRSSSSRELISDGSRLIPRNLILFSSMTANG
jgi:hypothetical protein